MLKRKWITVLFFCLLLVLPISANVQCKPQDFPGVKAQITRPYRFECLSQDGDIDGPTWESGSGTVDDTDSYLYIGYYSNIPLHIYRRWRSYVYFNTSILPDARVISATLWLYQTVDIYGARFNVRILNGQPTYPHDPLNGSDFNRTLYSGNGGEPSSFPNASTYFPIRLTVDGVSWINNTGLTKFTLWADWDADEDYGFLGSRWISLGSSESKSTNPYLIVDLEHRSNIVFTVFGCVWGIMVGIGTGLSWFKRNAK